MPRTPKKWTEEEDRILREAVKEQNNGSHAEDWHRIAARLPGRNNKDCRKRWHYRGSGVVRKGPWKLDEDHRLWTGVQKHGSKWALVAQEVETRNGDQCAKRWKDALDPNLDHSDWVEEEDEKLREAVEKYGRNWKTIVETYFPRRSRLSAKNRYALLERKREIQDQISAFSPQFDRKKPLPSALSWSPQPASSVSGSSATDRRTPLSPESSDPAGIESPDAMQLFCGEQEKGAEDVMEGSGSADNGDFYPWSLSPPDSGCAFSPRGDISPTDQPLPTSLDNWTTSLFEDIGFLGDETMGNSTEVAPTASAERSLPLGNTEYHPMADTSISSDTLEERAPCDAPLLPGPSTLVDGSMSLDGTMNLALPSVLPGGAQNYTISVERASSDTIKSILDILLKTGTPVTIQSGSS